MTKTDKAIFYSYNAQQQEAVPKQLSFCKNIYIQYKMLDARYEYILI